MKKKIKQMLVALSLYTNAFSHNRSPLFVYL